MIRSFNGKTPRIAETAWVSESAYVVGDVEIGEYSSVWPGAVIRGDFGRIVIGANTHIEDNCVLHCAPPAMTIGDNNIIGHAVVVHGRSVGSNCLIGNNATLLDDSEIGDGCVIAAGALVPPRTVVPAGSRAMGVPAVVAALPAGGRAPGASASGGYKDMAQRYKAAGL